MRVTDTSRRNGSRKAFPMHMPLQDHQELEAVGQVLEEAYGRSDEKSRALQHTLAALDTLRGRCSRSSC